MNNMPAEQLPCPSCRQEMIALCVDALPTGQQTLDYCATCRGIWFDVHESTRLAPTSILELFRIIRDAQVDDTLPIAPKLACPRCRRKLVATRDIARSGPFAYDRCPQGHGRFTPFAQFLTEKGFVRYLPQKEIEEIAIRIGQINCHACGAPIDIRHSTACPHCRAPIAVLDAEAMAKAFAGYDKATAPRIRKVTGDLFVSIPSLPYLPRRSSKSLLELGIGAVAGLFE